MRLHGTIRAFHPVYHEPERPPIWQEIEKPVPQSLVLCGTEIRKGSKVWLRPRPGGDVLDIVLVGKVAIIEAIEQDYEGRLHLAVVLQEDPGRDLGEMRQPGHCFFFSPDEVVPFEENTSGR